jgi:hypothetical protein
VLRAKAYPAEVVGGEILVQLTPDGRRGRGKK